MSTPVSRNVVIRNKQGLHARPASEFAKLAYTFSSQITVVCENRRVDGRSPMELLTMGAKPGTELTLEATGDDAQEAVAALAQLVEVGFLEEDAENEQSQEKEEPSS
jgi:phosphotransferase system HPr (HPr) family protein